MKASTLILILAVGFLLWKVWQRKKSKRLSTVNNQSFESGASSLSYEDELEAARRKRNILDAISSVPSDEVQVQAPTPSVANNRALPPGGVSGFNESWDSRKSAGITYATPSEILLGNQRRASVSSGSSVSVIPGVVVSNPNLTTRGRGGL